MTIASTPVPSPVSETPVAAPAPVTTGPDHVAAPAAEPISPKMAALVKKQKEAAAAHVRLQQEQGAWQAKQQEFAAREAAVAQRQAEIDAWEHAFKQDPVKALEQRGLTYAQLTEMAVAGGVTPEYKMQQLEQEIRAVKEERASESIAARKAAEEQAVAGFKAEISRHVEAGSDKYKHIKAFGGDELIFDTIDAHAAKTGKLMSVDEAAELVEAYLEAEAKTFASKLPGTTTAAPAAPEAAVPAESDPAVPSPSSQWGHLVPQPRAIRSKPVLSNSVGAVTVPVSSKPTKALTVEEWVARNRK